MKNNIIIISIYICVISCLAITEIYTQPVNNHTKNLHVSSPNAAAFNKYVDIPVSHYTGVPNIALPIYTIQEGPLVLPISLSFHAGGIRVDDVSSWVGMGWSLNTGGSLSRTVQGIEDEHGDGYYTLYGQNPAEDRIFEGALGRYDFEPDIFSFTAGNYSGKFLFDKNRVIRMFPVQDVKVIPDNSFNTFKIITPDGTIYHFGTKEFAYSSIQGYPNRWMLDKIETADLKFNINFSYQEENYSNEVRSAKYKVIGQVTYSLNGNTGSCGGGIYGTFTSFQNFKTQRLVSLTTGSNTSQVQFVPSSNLREDLSSKSLSYISISEGTFCKNYYFNYDFTKSISGANQAKQKRLRLLSIQEKSCDNTLEKPAHIFEYESGDGTNGLNIDGSFFMPEQLSRSIDHWGYYNEGQNSWQETLTPNIEIIDHTGNTVNYGQADRVAKPIGKKGLLKKIQYPEGGNTSFEYENNDYWGQSETGSELNSRYGPCVSDPYTCCETQIQNLNWTFPSGTNFQEICIHAYGETRGYCGAPHEYFLRVYNSSTNAYLGAYSFNLPPQYPYNNGENSGVRKKKITDIFTPVTGVSYRFEMTLNNMYGYFKLMQFPFGNMNGAGFRVKKITTHDGVSVGSDIVTNYEYKGNDPSNPNKSSGKLRTIPSYGQSFIFYGNIGWEASTGYINQAVTVIYDRTYYPESNLDGIVHGYSFVKEIQHNNGITEYIFKNDENLFLGNSAIPIHLSNFDEENGKNLSQTEYSTSNLIQSTSDTYYKPYTNIPSGVLTKTISLGLCDGMFPWLWVQYTGQLYEAKSYLTNSTTVKDGVSSATSFIYDQTNRHTMPVSVTSTNSDGKVHKEEYMYNHDYDNSTGLRDALVSKNIIASPFRTTIKVDNVHIDGPETGYNWFNLTTGLIQTNGTGAHPRPYQIYRYEKTYDSAGNLAATGGITLQATINSYDTYGNIKQVTTPNWDPEDFEWFSNGLLKKRTFLNHNKEYTYHPGTKLLATAKEIDGQIMYFDYDKLTRLSKTVQRKVGSTENVKTEYTYHYKEPSGDIYNWVKTKTTYTPTTNSGLVTRETKDITDGIGRSIQTIKINHSPNSKDVIFAKTYDNRGRLWKEYLPYESTGNTGAYMAIPSGTKFTETLYESSPLNRISSVTPPGWYATTYSYGANTGTDVLNPLTGANYIANSLSKVIVTDPMNNRSIEFKDKRGRNVMTWKTDVSYSNNAQTYTVYDNKDRISKVIPPGAVISNTDLIFAYTYDQDDKVLTKSIPSKGVEKFVYNNKDQLTFSQDAKWVATQDWLHTKYDAYGRLLNNGRYTHSSSANPSGDLNATYADQYKEISYFSLLSDGVKLGKIKQTKDKILGTSNTWIQKDFNYDSFGRAWTITGSNHLYNDLSAESVTMTYDFADNVMTENRTHKPSASSTEQITVNKRWTYDASGRVKDHFTALSGVETNISNQNYNFRDELIEKNQGAASFGGINTYLQSLDFSYNDQGWLTKINQPTLGGTNIVFQTVCPSQMPNPGVYNLATNPDGNDLMYLEFNYDLNNTGITGLPTNSQKSGNISQIAWRVRGRDRQAYNYTYDFLDRMTTSEYYDVNASSVASATNRYNENLSYDARGNINALVRTGHYQDASNNCVYGSIDNLGYFYTSNTNQVYAIADYQPNTYAKPKGFNPGSGGGFTYDLAGNLKSDGYKGITNINYNYLNLPTNISWGSTKSIDIVYDAAGNKLSKTVKTGTTINSIQDYVMGIEYNKLGTATRKPEAVYHTEGRFFNTSTTSTPSWRTEYSIKDHLGNTRLTFTDKNNNAKIDVTNNASTNEILQENHYYSFGMAHEGTWMINDAAKDNPYQYNGKEFNADHGLNWNDYGMRYYDPTIGKWMSVDPLADLAPGWTPYRYGFNNPILYTDPVGLFESKAAAKDYAKENGIKTGWFRDNKIVENSDGTWSIDNKKEHSSISDYGGDLGVMTAALVVEEGVHLRDIGMDGFNALSDPNSESYNPNATIYLDWTDRAYFFGSMVGLASPTARVASASKAATVVNQTAKSPVGRSGNVLQEFTQGVRNTPSVINGRKFTGHALDQMQNRGILSPTAVNDVIKNPAKILPGNTPGTSVFIRDNLKVVTNAMGDVLTVVWQ